MRWDELSDLNAPCFFFSGRLLTPAILDLEHHKRVTWFSTEEACLGDVRHSLRISFHFALPWFLMSRPRFVREVHSVKTHLRHCQLSIMGSRQQTPVTADFGLLSSSLSLARSACQPNRLYALLVFLFIFFRFSTVQLLAEYSQNLL